MAQKNTNKLYSPVAVSEDITAAKTLDKYDTGKIFRLKNSDGNGYQITLPAVTAVESGWFARFVIGTPPSMFATAYTIVAPAAVIHGMAIPAGDGGGSDGASTGGTGVTTITLNFQSPIGDVATLVCDGTYYYTSIVSSGVAASTLTSP
jgi:hypothetical protein